MLLNWGDLFNRASWCISPRCLTDHPETQGNNKKHLSFPQACERAGQFCFKPQAYKSAREALLHVSHPSRASGLLGQALLLVRAEVQEGPAETCESSRGVGSEPAPSLLPPSIGQSKSRVQIQCQGCGETASNERSFTVNNKRAQTAGGV